MRFRWKWSVTTRGAVVCERKVCDSVPVISLTHHRNGGRPMVRWRCGVVCTSVALVHLPARPVQTHSNWGYGRDSESSPVAPHTAISRSPKDKRDRTVDVVQSNDTCDGTHGVTSSVEQTCWCARFHNKLAYSNYILKYNKYVFYVYLSIFDKWLSFRMRWRV